MTTFEFKFSQGEIKNIQKAEVQQPELKNIPFNIIGKSAIGIVNAENEQQARDLVIVALHGVMAGYIEVYDEEVRNSLVNFETSNFHKS